ncbi:hypothetical protein [Mucilaginibacter endophyticus]|uniref:hypothetical protein n=1 Tax=Mucilaginibacter endophyticus TaxID=2675003 RepID=UPI000E0D5904|nr:hypothetical protein [Mucilaginibacter endophyticus]
MGNIKTDPYQIVKHFRGNYQVLDAEGRDLIGHYVSLHKANQTVIAHKLQDKALSDPRVLQRAEAMTTLKGESLRNWLYTTLIRFEIDELRLVINKPKKLKELHDSYIERMMRRLNK